MEMYKPKTGDIIKILPMIEPDGKITWIKQLDVIHLKGKIIYDTTFKGYLKKISKWSYFSNTIDRIPVSSRYYMNIFINGQIHTLQVGITLFKVIQSNQELLQLRSDLHLHIVRDESFGYPIYDKSYVSKHDWTPPVNLESKSEVLNFIKKYQPDFTKHINDNSLFTHKKLLIEHLGKDVLGELISQDRTDKLEKLGID